MFINCPFDSSYRKIFDAIVFAVCALGFDPRCALDRDDGTEERLTKILERYRKSLSDLSGRDIRAHNGRPTPAITAVRAWLVTESGRTDAPGASYVIQQYRSFRRQLPALCEKARRKVTELSFSEYRNMAVNWLRVNA